jgi:uncharacterized protein YbjT (DUF2867 family)
MIHTRILVCGATGRQGGAVARRLLAANLPVRILVRNPSHAGAQSLAEQGAQISTGDFSDFASLDRALDGVTGVFSVQPLLLGAWRREVEWGKDFAIRAKRNGIAHFVYSSVDGADSPGDVPHFRSKQEIEYCIRESGLNVTILRPAGFMENLLLPVVRKGIRNGKLTSPYEVDTPQRLIAVDDIGRIAATVFLKSDDYTGGTLPLIGDVLSTREQANVLTRVCNRPIRPGKLPNTVTRLMLGSDLYRMFRHVESQAGIPPDRETMMKILPEGPTDFESWAKQQQF